MSPTTLEKATVLESRFEGAATCEISWATSATVEVIGRPMRELEKGDVRSRVMLRVGGAIYHDSEKKTQF